MQLWHKALLAGASAIAIGCCGAAAPALAQGADAHIMTVRLPDGSVAQISYTGTIAPQVSFGEAPAPASAPIDGFAPLLPPAMFGPNSPFAALERISAEMDREAAAMFRQAENLATAARSGQLTEAAMQSLMPGSASASASYSFVSTMSGNGFCTQSIEITSPGNGAAPRVVSHSSGECGPMGESSGSVNQPAPTVTPQPFGEPGPVWTGAPAQIPYANPAPAPAAQPDVLWTSAPGARPYAGLVEEIPPAQQQR